MILIDEYQDIIRGYYGVLLEYFIDKGVGPQFGVFWGCMAGLELYTKLNKPAGLIEHKNIIEIKKSTSI